MDRREEEAGQRATIETEVKRESASKENDDYPLTQSQPSQARI